MSGYFGSEEQQRLQRQAEANADLITNTPGACQTGRTMGCDDPDKLGWDRITEFLDRDGICGFRLLSPEAADQIRARLLGQDYRFDAWDVFLAPRAAALAAAEAILARGLPDGLAELDRPTDPKSEYVTKIQVLMNAAGVVPFSGSLLVGALGPATTTVIGDRHGEIVAAAHCYLPHNAHSPYHRYAWGGLVAVLESKRGSGLGSYINARMIVSAFRDLDATHIYELVSATNVSSRKMVVASGLRLEPTLICGVVAAKKGARFTR
ncbi:GNAT family N-acetyltransferase [Nitratireductor mangrovi]|uniref:GNAT family N-acetyltransferase n=1 Tax=Nitratireductor mangrovi TaxID=2599600 RepID=A0A5B8KX56_9HYPH|nr:GNAT family N-acetyltransferase [Nitratireductor mangrovi]QDZ00156.1 GNAT family N-acetyltransferase [Nitratireductor mangrovi]